MRGRCPGVDRPGVGFGLAGQPRHQVDIDAFETGLPGQFHRRHRLAAGVDAPQGDQRGVGKGLDADRQPVYPGAPVIAKAARLGGTRVGFEGDLGISREADASGGVVEQGADRGRRKQARRAAAENTLPSLRSWTQGSSRSRSRHKAARYAASGIACLAWCELKSQ